MSSVDVTSDASSDVPAATTKEMREVVVVPVTDADRSKRFYQAPGRRLDADFTSGDAFRDTEARCYLRNPDDHLIEVGQTTTAGGWQPPSFAPQFVGEFHRASHRTS
jgi:catechol 2,3-dioxygenase-like lactoylglutathione lyase family enzyme